MSEKKNWGGAREGAGRKKLYPHRMLVPVNAEQLQTLKAYQMRHRLPSRNAAVRHLIARIQV